MYGEPAPAWKVALALLFVLWVTGWGGVAAYGLGTLLAGLVWP